MSTNTVDGGLGTSYYSKSVGEVLSKVMVLTTVDAPGFRGSSDCGIQIQESGGGGNEPARPLCHPL